MTPRRAAVVGLGLMGGSLARDLAALGVEVWGHDPDADAVREARAEGVLRGEIPPSLEGFDLVVVATPVDAARGVLERLAPAIPAGCVVTDVGSTKRSILSAAVRLGIAERFVGSHPLAGDHRSGWGASRRGLFAGARVYLCPTPATSPGALEAVREVWHRLGAAPEATDAAAHDRRLAWTSHLPQVASSALAQALAGRRLSRGSLGPGGRDATRLAGSSPEMWAPLCLDNADLLEEALDDLAGRLSEFRDALRERDRASLHRFFAAAREWSLQEPA